MRVRGCFFESFFVGILALWFGGFGAMGAMAVTGCSGEKGRGKGVRNPPAPGPDMTEEVPGPHEEETDEASGGKKEMATWDTTLPPKQPPRKKVLASGGHGICQLFAQRSRACVDELVNAMANLSGRGKVAVTPQMKKKIRETFLKAITSGPVIKACERNLKNRKAVGHLKKMFQCANRPTCQGFAKCFVGAVRSKSSGVKVP